MFLFFLFFEAENAPTAPAGPTDAPVAPALIFEKLELYNNFRKITNIAQKIQKPSENTITNTTIRIFPRKHEKFYENANNSTSENVMRPKSRSNKGTIDREDFIRFPRQVRKSNIRILKNEEKSEKNYFNNDYEGKSNHRRNLSRDTISEFQSEIFSKRKNNLNYNIYEENQAQSQEIGERMNFVTFSGSFSLPRFDTLQKSKLYENLSHFLFHNFTKSFTFAGRTMDGVSPPTRTPGSKITMAKNGVIGHTLLSITIEWLKRFPNILHEFIISAVRVNTCSITCSKGKYQNLSTSYERRCVLSSAKYHRNKNLDIRIPTNTVLAINSVRKQFNGRIPKLEGSIGLDEESARGSTIMFQFHVQTGVLLAVVLTIIIIMKSLTSLGTPSDYKYLDYSGCTSDNRGFRDKLIVFKLKSSRLQSFVVRLLDY